MSRFAGPAAMVVVLAFVLLFTRWNGGERMTLDLGVHVFYRVPTTWVIFAAFLLGMTVMLLTGIHADLKVRRYLRERLARRDEEREEPPAVDRLQQDLFAAPATVPPPPLRPGPPVQSDPPVQAEPPPRPAPPVQADPPLRADPPPRSDPPPRPPESRVP